MKKVNNTTQRMSAKEDKWVRHWMGDTGQRANVPLEAMSRRKTHWLLSVVSQLFSYF